MGCMGFTLQQRRMVSFALINLRITNRYRLQRLLLPEVMVEVDTVNDVNVRTYCVFWTASGYQITDL